MNTTTHTATHGLTVGDVLVSTWGYEQTNVDYFEVTRATPKTVLLRPINATREHGEHWGTYYSTPTPGDFAGDAFRCKVKHMGESPYVNINSFAVATKWTGRTQLGSTYA